MSNLNADFIVFSSKVMQTKQKQLKGVSRTDEVIGPNQEKRNTLTQGLFQDGQASLIFPDTQRSTQIRNNIVTGKTAKLQHFQTLTHQSNYINLR